MVETTVLNSKNNWTYTFENLPGDQEFTVQERDFSGYTASYSGITASEDGYEVTITNTPVKEEPGKGSLTLTKAVQGGGRDAASKVFQFRVTGPDYEQDVTITGSGSKTLHDLEPGRYTVHEVGSPDIEGYDLVVTGNGSMATLAEGGHSDLTITNTYTEPGKGSLTIHKTVEGPDADALPKSFTFTVTGPGGYSRTVTVPAGGSATLSDLEPGEYTVEEADASVEGYEWSVMGDEEVTVTAGSNASADFTNTYEETPLGGNGTITITKVVQGGGEEALSKVYTFDVYDNHTGELVRTVTVTGQGSATVGELPVGEYRIVERDAAIDGLGWQMSITSGGVVTIVPDGHASVTVTNTYGPDEPGDDVDIPDEQTPLSPGTPSNPTTPTRTVTNTTYTTTTTRQATPDDTVEITDEGVPLGYLPKTGDATNLALIASVAGIAVAAMAVGARLLKREGR